jgi:adenylosuccinate lyase
MATLDLPVAEVATQVYARKRDFEVLSLLAAIAASAARFAFNVRLLQSPVFGEWAEGFAPGQIGSSAMPWKRNPIDAENVTSLARLVASLPAVAWANAADNLLERTLDDSANRRIVLPEGFLATDEILRRCAEIATRLVVDRGAIRALLDRFGPFAASEQVLLAAAAAGGDRQSLHEVLRGHSLAAWDAVAAGEPNPLVERLAAEPRLLALVPADRIRALLAAPEKDLQYAMDQARAAAARARAAVGT